MPRYELVEGKSAKFWEIKVKSSEVTVKYGRMGTSGQTRVKQHGSPANAKAAAAKLTEAKVKKGYAKRTTEKRASKKITTAAPKKAARKTAQSKPGKTKDMAADLDMDLVDKVANALVEQKRMGSNTVRLPKLSAVQKKLLARCILETPASYTNDRTKFAFGLVLRGDDQDRIELLERGILKSDHNQEELLPLLKSRIKGPKSPEVEMLLSLLHVPKTKAHEKYIHFDYFKEAILRLLRPVAHTPIVFDRLMTTFDDQKLKDAQKRMIGMYFCPFNGQCIIKRLSKPQVRRVAKTLILANHRRHPLYYQAGHQLARLNHPACVEIYAAALEEETEKGVVTSIYSALDDIDTPAARKVLVHRLYRETSEVWYLSNALKRAKAHTDVMRSLRKTKDIGAANVYASAIVEHLKRHPPMAELVKEVLKWKNVEDDAHLKYVLLEGACAALKTKDKALAVSAFIRAETIKAKPLSTYHKLRRNRYVEPFTADKALRKQILKLAGA